MSNLADAVETINNSKSPDVAAGSYVLSKISTDSMTNWRPEKLGALTIGILECLKRNGAEFDLKGAAMYVANHTGRMAYEAYKARMAKDS